MTVRDESMFLGPPRPDEGPYAPAPPDWSPKDDLAPEKGWRPDYLGAFRAIHRHSHWLVSSFFCGLIGLIPIVGHIVQLGYMMENAESLHRTNGRQLVAFDFARFTEYLTRGVGPFLIAYLFGMGLWIIQMGIIHALGWGLDLQKLLPSPDQPPDMNLLLTEVFTAQLRALSISLPLQFLVQPLAFALALRGGLSGTIGESFRLDKAFDFVRRTLPSIWLTMILYWPITFFLSILGLLLCLVGTIPVSGYLVLVNAWLCFVLYRVYLNRGGEPIPLKPAPLVAELA